MVMVEKTDMTAEMDQADKTVQAERLKTLPAADGFHMPGEFEPHKGTIMIWPERPGSWAYGQLVVEVGITGIRVSVVGVTV